MGFLQIKYLLALAVAGKKIPSQKRVVVQPSEVLTNPVLCWMREILPGPSSLIADAYAVPSIKLCLVPLLSMVSFAVHGRTI